MFFLGKHVNRVDTFCFHFNKVFKTIHSATTKWIKIGHNNYSEEITRIAKFITTQLRKSIKSVAHTDIAQENSAAKTER